MRKEDMIFIAILFIIGLVLLPLSSLFSGYYIQVTPSMQWTIQGIMVVSGLFSWLFGGIALACIAARSSIE